MTNIFELQKELIHKNIDNFNIEKYDKKYLKEISSLSIRMVTEFYNDENREHELNMLTHLYGQRDINYLYDSNYIKTFIIVNSGKLYGYISVAYDDDIGNYESKFNGYILTGLYIDELLRGTNIASKLFNEVIKCIKNEKKKINYKLNNDMTLFKKLQNCHPIFENMIHKLNNDIDSCSNTLYVEVCSYAERAEKFYEKIGFTYICERTENNNNLKIKLYKKDIIM